MKKPDALAPLACLSLVYINHTILDIFSKADKISDFSTFFEIYGIGGCWKLILSYNRLTLEKERKGMNAFFILVFDNQLSVHKMSVFVQN